MINFIYQLVQPKTIVVEYADLSLDDRVIVKPDYMSICKADQRYYQGQRDRKIMKKKLPMALIHEACGTVVYDGRGQFKKGQKVVLVPNVPVKEDENIYENYREGSYFLSSGYDGFMQELVSVDQRQVVPYEDIDPVCAAVTEYVSVAVHSAKRLEKTAHNKRDVIGIWGDGSLGYITAIVVKKLFPEMKIVVIGHNENKLSMFSFVNETYLESEMPDDLRVDHAFECCGGTGSRLAIDCIINHINPQGTVLLMGVSEEPVDINTRMVLEKGLTLVGCSRSGREDFETAVCLLKTDDFQSRLKGIITLADPVRNIDDIHRVFAEDMSNEFKVVFKWEV